MKRLVYAFLAVTSLSIAAFSAPSHAAEPQRPSAALRAYGLDWLQYVRSRDLPPTRYAICIVDTGVAITPDTPADNPNGPIIKRLSIDGGSGEPQGTTPQHLHGTRMAATAVAPRNGWGTVGLFPQGRVISVRATINGEATFRVAAYTRGIHKCLSQSEPVAAINISIGCGSCVDDVDLPRLAEAVDRANVRDVAVVVAAGNSPGGLAYPASAAGVVPVGAGGARGRLCPYGSWGASVLALAPACPIAGAEPLSGAWEPRADGGSSSAAVEISTLVSALRSLRPQSRSPDVLRWITATARLVEFRRVVAGRRAAAAAGLAELSRRGRASAR